MALRVKVATEMMAKLFITQVMMKVPDLREAEDVKGYTDVGKGKGYW